MNTAPLEDLSILEQLEGLSDALYDATGELLPEKRESLLDSLSSLSDGYAELQETIRHLQATIKRMARSTS